MKGCPEFQAIYEVFFVINLTILLGITNIIRQLKKGSLHKGCWKPRHSVTTVSQRLTETRHIGHTWAYH